MEPVVKPAAKLAAKRLPKVQATTVLALKSMRASEDVALMATVAELAEWGAPPRVITELIGIPPGAGLTRICEKAQGRIMGGRPAESVIVLLDDLKLHLEASIFLREFIIQHALDGRQAMAPEPFIRAYRYYFNVLHVLRGRASVSVDYALMVARKYLVKEVLLAHCDCGVHYLQNHAVVRIKRGLGCGACPSCASKAIKVKQLVIDLPETSG